jgi:hypothetical protein
MTPIAQKALNKVLQSDLSHEHEDKQDDDNQAETAAGAVSPIAAVAPGRQDAQKHKNQDYQQNHS